MKDGEEEEYKAKEEEKERPGERGRRRRIMEDGRGRKGKEGEVVLHSRQLIICYFVLRIIYGVVAP
jgi:hypothetical protein